MSGQNLVKIFLILRNNKSPVCSGKPAGIGTSISSATKRQRVPVVQLSSCPVIHDSEGENVLMRAVAAAELLEFIFVSSCYCFNVHFLIY